jgi:CheY-like chemotaxis protein
MAVPGPHPKHNMRAIVIDDHPPSALAVAGLLERSGCAASICVDAPKCVAQAIDAGVDLVTLDIRMPGLDGFEVLALIRSHEHTRQRPGVPVVAVTGLVSAGDRAQTLSAGCIAHLCKPVERSALELVLEQVKQLRGELSRARATADAVAVLRWVDDALATAGGDRVRVIAGLAMAIEKQGSHLLHETLLAAYEARPEAGRQTARELAAVAEGVGAAVLHTLCLDLAACLHQGAPAFEIAAVRARAELDRLLFTLREHALH